MENICNGFDIICPSCDGEFLIDYDNLFIFDQIREKIDKPKIITISTKRKLDEKIVRAIKADN